MLDITMDHVQFTIILMLIVCISLLAIAQATMREKIEMLEKEINKNSDLSGELK